MLSGPSVNILLSVYNGEKYLATQLDSLLAQTYRNITIYIRDDEKEPFITGYQDRSFEKQQAQKPGIYGKFLDSFAGIGTGGLLCFLRSG